MTVHGGFSTHMKHEPRAVLGIDKSRHGSMTIWSEGCVRTSAIACVCFGCLSLCRPSRPGVDRLEIEDVPQAAIDLAQQPQWCLAGLFGQICLVESDHRSDVHDRVFGQP